MENLRNHRNVHLTTVDENWWDLPNNQYLFSILRDLLNFYSNEYDNKVVLGDFNFKPSSPSMLSLMGNQSFVSLIKNKTFFKRTGSCIDLILTNRKYSFKNSSSYETVLSDHHRLIYSVMKTTFTCEESKKSIYRNYLNFFQKDFQSDLLLNIGDGKNHYSEFEKNLKCLISMLRRKPKYFEGIISPTSTKHWEKLLWNVLNLKIKQVKRRPLRYFKV